MKEIQSAVFLTVLFLIAWTDAGKRCIPNRMLFFLVLMRGFFLLFNRTECCPSLLGFLCGGGSFLLLYLISRQGIGAGDVKLCAVIGGYLGGERFLSAAFWAAVYAAVCCMAGLRQGKVCRTVPFGTFLFFGVVTEMLLCQKGV